MRRGSRFHDAAAVGLLSEFDTQKAAVLPELICAGVIALRYEGTGFAMSVKLMGQIFECGPADTRTRLGRLCWWRSPRMPTTRA